MNNLLSISDQHDLLKSITHISSIVPSFGFVYDQFASCTLDDFLKYQFSYNPNPIYKTRRQELISSCDPLEPNIEISVLPTLHHSGLSTHPIQVAAEILLKIFNSQKKNKIYVSTSSISVNHPAQVDTLTLFESKSEIHINNFKLIRGKNRKKLVSFVEQIQTEKVKELTEITESLLSDGIIGSTKHSLLSEFCRHLHKSSIDQNIQKFTQQMIFVNGWLSNQYIDKDCASSTINELISEDMFTSWASNFLLKDKNNIIYKLIFNKDWQNLFMKYFDGVPGAFNKNKCSGTIFFWGVSKKGNRISLTIEGNSLVGTDFTCELSEESILKSLNSGTLIPSNALIYLFLIYYAGIKVLGGFLQTSNLLSLRSSWLNLLTELGETNEYNLSTKIPIDGLLGCTIFAFSMISNQMRASNALDIAEKKINRNFIDQLLILPMKNLLDIFSFELLRLLLPNTRINSFIQEKIFRSTGLPFIKNHDV